MDINNQNQLWLQNTDGVWKDDLMAAQGDTKELEDRFYKSLEFGTGGLRGVIGTGTNRMNIYTVKRASKGLSDYIVSIKPDGAKIAVSYDSRNYSKEFAAAAAEVFAAAGIEVHIYKELQPTPLCSFAVRRLGCDAGIMVTASHNPKIYNGYKVYGADGCQLNLEASEKVLEYINLIDDYFGIKTGKFEDYVNSGAIKYIDDSIYQEFLGKVAGCSQGLPAVKGIKVVYTPLNGTGNVPVREILRRRGFGAVSVVPEQEMPDGNFTTCPYPNPESPAALKLAIERAAKEEAHIVIATDPDCDRVGIAVRHNGEYVLLNGNETGVLMAEYILSSRKRNQTLPDRPYIIKTIVTTDIIHDIIKDYGGEVGDVLTGFKFIGERLKLMEDNGTLEDFVLGFEESYGYLAAPYVRDKDGVVAAMLAAEMCDYYAAQGQSLVEVLEGLYKKYGYHGSILHTVEFKGKTGIENMNKRIAVLRSKPPEKFGTRNVIEFKDYSKGIDGLPPSDVMSFVMGDAKILVRPSGTEPKLKVYILGKGSTKSERDAMLNSLLPEIVAYFE